MRIADRMHSPDRFHSHRCERIGMIALLVLLLATATTGPARAQSCPLAPRVEFAGHNLPLNTPPDIQPMTLVRVFQNLSFDSPVGLKAPDDTSNRIFVWERGGRVLVFENDPDVATTRTFLDLSSEIVSGGEQGLLGLAFDPDFGTNGRFYVNFTTANCAPSNLENWCTKIVRYEVSANDPDLADASSALDLLEFPQFASNHNGGALEFGPDGMLYIATGDGGGAGDPRDNGQDLSTPLGALLRIDVRDPAVSIIPPDNPFVATPGADPTIFHFGLRNPWRVTFDRATGDLYIADVGQTAREEVDLVPAGSAGGLNFGWNYCEGTLDFRAGARCSDIVSVPPVIEYGHDANGGFVIIGGYVYRDDELPELQGAYIYHDAGSGKIWAWDRTPAANPAAPGNPGVLIASNTPALNSFGEDRNGGFYGLGAFPGFVYKLRRTNTGSGNASFPALLSQTGLFADLGSMTPLPGVIEYEVTSILWSDGAEKRRWIALPGDSRITFHSEQAWSFPIGTALIKHFELPLVGGGTRPVETRIFLRQEERWVGVTYRWNASGTDADLLTNGLEEEIDLGGGQLQTWRYPSSAGCLTCHTQAAGRVLGLQTRQLADIFNYANGSEIQLEALNCAGYFDLDIRDPARYEKMVAIDDLSASPTERVRSYHATNCEMCHQPTGPAPGTVDFRFTAAVSEWNVLDIDPVAGDLGLVNPKLVATGNKEQSILWIRQQSIDPNIKMARGTLATDDAAIAVIGDWIDFDTASLDSDRDLTLDTNDNCPADPNPDQTDTDMDGLGDVCDPDALPRLLVLSASVPNGPFQEGDPVQLSATIENQGGGDSADFPVTFYLSADSKFDPGLDSPSGHCWIESLSAGNTFDCGSTTASIPKNLVEVGDPMKSFYWLTCANSSRIQPEGTDAVDCLASTEPVLVPEPAADHLAYVALASVFALFRLRQRRIVSPSRDTTTHL